MSNGWHLPGHLPAQMPARSGCVRSSEEGIVPACVAALAGGVANDAVVATRASAAETMQAATRRRVVCDDFLMAKSPDSSLRPEVGPAPSRAPRGRIVQEIRNCSPGRLLASSSVLLLALTACGHDDSVTSEPPGPHGSPTSAGECSDLPMVGADPGMVLGTDWSTETHAYGQPVDLTVCVTTADSGTVRVRSSDAGITVTPRTQRVPATGNGLLTVEVRVASGTPSGAAMRLVQYGGGGVLGDSTGPSIVTTADGWHFDRP